MVELMVAQKAVMMVVPKVARTEHSWVGGWAGWWAGS